MPSIIPLIANGDKNSTIYPMARPDKYRAELSEKNVADGQRYIVFKPERKKYYAYRRVSKLDGSRLIGYYLDLDAAISWVRYHEQK